MTTAAEDHPTSCPRCSADFAYLLEAITGGGLRYLVSCERCHEVYFEFSAPTLANARLAA